MMQPPFPPRGPRHNQPPPKPKPRKPAVVFQPQTYRQFQAGANLIINAIRPTLGPVPRTVAIESVANRTKLPEMLDDGATIARRIIQLKGRGQDVGAMFVRHMLWELHENSGDGTATAAVLFQSLFNQGVRYVVDGGNAMRLRYHLEALTPMLLEQIGSQTVHLTGKENLASLAETICFDPPLAKMLGEIFDIIGEYGRLEIRSGSGRELERSYVEGIYWDGGLASREMMEDLKARRTTYENAAILITDVEIKEPQELAPVLDVALGAGINRLVIMAKTITDRALGMLLMKENREKIQVIVVKTPGVEIYTQRYAMEDLALLTGSKVINTASGDTLALVTADHFGRARRAWADYEFFGIVAGRGDPRALRSHIANLRKSFANVTDSEDRRRLQARLGKLMGGAATLYIGDYTPVALEARKALAERTAEALRGAMREGVVPGGGVTLLGCRALLREKMKTAQEDEERAACRMLLKALEAPIRTLMDNAGFDPYEWMPEINKAGPGFGFDTIRRQVTDMTTSGVYDSTSVVKNALYSAIHSAALALTVDVLVHRKLPPESLSST